ncbi:MAG: hypothetical protein P4M13_00865 [Alphaproteobacteria bacterium]|nr:hypothetical protein [Alphaproteobacteria bacterium]
MVQEIRKIIFSNDELFSAFNAYARTSPSFLPPGKLCSCAPVDQDSGGSAVKVETSEQNVVVRGADVLRPLILFCLENNIMLPREGRKTFSIANTKAVLTVELNLEYNLDSTEAPMTSEYARQIKIDGFGSTQGVGGNA